MNELEVLSKGIDMITGESQKESCDCVRWHHGMVQEQNPQPSPTPPIACYLIYTYRNIPLRHTVSFESEWDAWRCYFDNRSDWKELRASAIESGYTCRKCYLTEATPIQEKKQ